MTKTAQQRLRLVHELDQLEGALEEGNRLVKELAEVVLTGDWSRAAELKARAARLRRYAQG